MESLLCKLDHGTLIRFKKFYFQLVHSHTENETGNIYQDEEEEMTMELEELQAILLSCFTDHHPIEYYAFLFQQMDLAESFYLSPDLLHILIESSQNEEQSCHAIRLELVHELYQLFFAEKTEEEGTNPKVTLQIIARPSIIDPWNYPLKLKNRSIVVFHTNHPPSSSSSTSALRSEEESNILQYQTIFQYDRQSPHDRSNFPIKTVFSAVNLNQFHFGIYYSASSNISHESSTNIDARKPSSFLITTPLYDYVQSLEDFFDFFYWEFNAINDWNEEIENILLELLICIHEDFQQMILQWKSLFGGISNSLPSSNGEQDQSVGNNNNPGTDLEHYYEMIVLDLQQILLPEHSNYSIGRLQQTLEQIIELQSMTSAMGMFKLPFHFYQKIQQFIVFRSNQIFKRMGKQFSILFLQLLETGSDYLSTCENSSSDQIRRFLNYFKGKMSNALTAENVLSLLPLSYEDITLITQLKPRTVDSFFQSNRSNSVLYIPVIPLFLITSYPATSYREVMRRLWSYAEVLFGDVINVDSALGYSLTDSSKSLQFHYNVIQTILEMGLTYTGNESQKLVLLFPLYRACIPLASPASSSSLVLWRKRRLEVLPVAFQKRLKDMKRIFKTKLQIPSPLANGPSHQLQFSINTNFSYCVEKLREYHGHDCWIGSQLEKIWHESMTTYHTFFIFELWYDRDILLAADFGHLLNGGSSCYIATRYSNRTESYRTIPSGFMLAYLECQYLYEHGCCLWDLGGVDQCPLMRYKYELTGSAPVERPIALEQFHNCLYEFKNQVREGEMTDIAQRFPTGVILENVTVEQFL